MQLPPGPSRRGPERPGYLETRRFDPASGSHEHDRDEHERGCGPEHAGYRISQRDRCGFESRPGPKGPGSSTVEQLPVCITTTAASRGIPSTLACGPEWSGYQGERPASAGRRGFESRLRSSAHTRRPAHHDRRLDTTERRSACRTWSSTSRARALPSGSSGVSRRRAVLLNRPGYHGGAYVHVFVEDTSRRGFRRDGYPSPRFRLEIADCTNRIRLEFDVETPGGRENSLYKIETLIGSLRRFQAGLQAEAELRAEREGDARRRPSSGRRHYHHERRANGLPEAHHDAPTSAVGADPGLDAGAQLGRRLHVVGRRLDTTPSLPRPRLRGRHATTRRSGR